MRSQRKAQQAKQLLAGRHWGPEARKVMNASMCVERRYGSAVLHTGTAWGCSAQRCEPRCLPAGDFLCLYEEPPCAGHKSKACRSSKPACKKVLAGVKGRGSRLYLSGRQQAQPFDSATCSRRPASASNPSPSPGQHALAGRLA